MCKQIFNDTITRLLKIKKTHLCFQKCASSLQNLPLELGVLMILKLNTSQELGTTNRWLNITK
jgi:hypothetical protein